MRNLLTKISTALVLTLYFSNAFAQQADQFYQADKDGKLNYTQVRMLNFITDHLISVTPNPAKDKIAITISGNDQPLKIKLLTTIGQQLKVYDMSGEYTQINLPHLAPGVYYIKNYRRKYFFNTQIDYRIKNIL